MRLSDVLSKAPSKERNQVEGFLGSRRMAWGQCKKIRVGKVALNFRCETCDDSRTFMSGEELSCLATGEKTVSIDVTLGCSVCGASMEAWFLVACDDDFYAPAPTVYLERYTENRRAVAVSGGQFEDLLERARIAYDNGLGAGAMIYLRRIFEDITAQVAEIADIPTSGVRGRRIPFRDLLESVNERHHIIPQRFASNGYTLFSELSEAIHGATSEEVALQRYPPCRQLVIGVVENVKRDQEIARAIDALGWDVDEVGTIAQEGLTHGQD